MMPNGGVVEEKNFTNASMMQDGMEQFEFQKDMEFIFEVVLLSIVGAFGVVGNIAAIVMFSRQSIQLKFHRLLMMLATFDLGYIILRWVIQV